MVQLIDLPTEVLQTIVRFTDTLYEAETGLTIFDVMRVNRQFRDIAVVVHFNLVRPSVLSAKYRCNARVDTEWSDDKWKEMIVKMVRHERCYLNYTKPRWPAQEKPQTTSSVDVVNTATEEELRVRKDRLRERWFNFQNTFHRSFVEF